MMKSLYDNREDFAIVVGVEWSRWYVGVAVEAPQQDVRIAVFRIGPLFLHILNRL